jgi:hypothetical protein
VDVGHFEEGYENACAATFFPFDIGVDGIWAVPGRQLGSASKGLKLKLGGLEPHIQLIFEIPVALDLKPSLALKLPDGLLQLHYIDLGPLVNHEDQVLQLGPTSVILDCEFLGGGEECGSAGLAG